MAVETTPVEEKKGVRTFFLVTDRKSLNKGKLVVNPIPLAVAGQTEFVGDAVLKIDRCIVEVLDDGSSRAYAMIKSMNRMDGVIRITKEVIEKVVNIGFEMGILEDN
jgi:hypothetical protein